RNWRLGQNPYAIAQTDFNGDGAPDVVITNSGSGDLLVFAGLRDGEFATPLRLPVGAKPRGVAIADFNGDGNPDLAVADSATGKVVVFLYDCVNMNNALSDNDQKGASRFLAGGLWGGPSVGLEVTNAGATFGFDCGHGSIDQKIELDRAGHFEASGVFAGEAGGPAKEVSATNENENIGSSNSS